MDIIERFLKYVSFDTQSAEESDSVPSTASCSSRETPAFWPIEPRLVNAALISSPVVLKIFTACAVFPASCSTHLAWPILFASALTKQRINRLADMVKFVSEQQHMRVSTSVLNELIEDAQLTNPPPAKGGKLLKIYYMTQASVQPPTFILFVNEPQLMHFSYLRFLENRLRETFGFEGTPLTMIIRGKKEDE